MGTALGKQLVVRFDRANELRCYITAVAAHGLLLVLFALLCAGLLPPSLFLLLGFFAYIRNFNALHEGSHARQAKDNPLRRLHFGMMIVHSPFQLGFHALASNHRLHHAFPCDLAHDPNASLNRGRWYVAAPCASIQPEFAALHFLRRTGFNARIRNVLVYNCAMVAILAAFAGTNIVWWLLLTRLGSLATWFAFDWILHHPDVYSRPATTSMPRLIQWLWIAMFSRANLNAFRFHALHHAYPGVADLQLPALASFLTEQDGQPPPTADWTAPITA